MGSPRDAGPLTTQRLPFSLSQRELWLDQLAWPGSPHLTIGGGGYLEGPVDLALLREALHLLVAESDALRLIPLQDGGQILLTSYLPTLEVVELAAGSNPREAMQAWWRTQGAQAFALDGSPPWRITVLRASDTLHGIALHFHHLVMDGWGSAQLMQRWGHLYNALHAGQTPPASDALPYAGFIDDSLAYRDSPAFSEDAAYWHALWPDLPPAVIERRFDAHPGVLPAAQLAVQPVARNDFARVEFFAKGLGVSPFVAYLAALAIYLARTSGQREVAIGVPSLNRSGKRYKRTLGMFVGVLALRLQVSPEHTVAEVVVSVHAALRAAMRHARYPLSELGRKLQAIRHGRDALFDAVFSFERQDYTLQFGDARSLDTRQFFSGTARYPLGVTMCEFHAAQDLELVLEGSAACFAPGQIALIGRRLCNLLDKMMDGPESPVASLDILPAEERWALVEGWHQHVATLAAPQSFVTLFDHQAALRPEALAVVWDGGDISYGALDQRAQRLACRLREAGVARDRVVAFALERSLDLVVAVLAIAKAGGAFLPLDPDAPQARVDSIVQESGAMLLLTQTALESRFSGLPVPCVNVADRPADIRPLPAPQAGDLAYVLFTSGSTGRPKGVMIEHATLARRLRWLAKTWGIDASDRSALATQISFDPSLIELCLPLIHGASIALPPPGRLLPETLPAFAARHAVTFMAFVPTTLRRFADAAASVSGLGLRVACCGGEVLSPETAARFQRNTGARLFNVYGPTETAIFATAWEYERRLDKLPLPIGQALDDTRIYVLDAKLRPLPFEERGEIHIGGSAIARGYLGRPDLDAEVFLPDPFSPGGRLYRTGDLGYIGCDGELHFVGRIDRQVKLRGYRIELGEVEAALLALEGVTQAAVQVVTRENKPMLHAWVAASAGWSAAELLRRLRQRLPDYMVPGGLSLLAALPESEVGKIDYQALPAPDISPVATASKAPATALEGALLKIWQTAFPGRECGVSDNFFDLGGDSLAAIEILSGIEKLTGRKLPLYQLTENPNVEQLALLLTTNHERASVMLELGVSGARVPLYLAASGYGDLARFGALAEALGPRCDLYMLQPPSGRAFQTLEELAALYAEAILQRRAAPGYLAGFSVAGLAALETARQLQLRGMAPRGLLMIDTVYPGLLFRTARLWRLFGWLVRLLRLQDLSLNGRRLGTLFRDPALLAQVRAVSSYKPQPHGGNIVLIQSSGFAIRQRWFFHAWRRLWGNTLQEMQVPGMHGSMFDENNVAALADAIASQLRNGEDGRA